MTHRYYEKFPAAPMALVSGISAACDIPTIVDAFLCRPNDLILEIFTSEDWQLNAERIQSLIEFVDVEPEDCVIESSDRAGIMVVSLIGTAFDFNSFFPEDPTSPDVAAAVPKTEEAYAPGFSSTAKWTPTIIQGGKEEPPFVKVYGVGGIYPINDDLRIRETF